MGIIKAGKMATAHVRVTLLVSWPVLWWWDSSPADAHAAGGDSGFTGGSQAP